MYGNSFRWIVSRRARNNHRMSCCVETSQLCHHVIQLRNFVPSFFSTPLTVPSVVYRLSFHDIDSRMAFSYLQILRTIARIYFVILNLHEQWLTHVTDSLSHCDNLWLQNPDGDWPWFRGLYRFHEHATARCTNLWNVHERRGQHKSSKRKRTTTKAGARLC